MKPFARVSSFLRRHCSSARDLALLGVLALVGAYVAFEFDIFENEGTATIRTETIELDEVLLVGGVLMLAVCGFIIRRHVEFRREIQRRLAAEQHNRELAFQDALTGLPNRRQFDEALDAALATPPAALATHAVLLLDLNGFKQVNDLHGHAVGDEVLCVVAQRLRMALRDTDLACRFGGDEFAVLSMHLRGAEAVTNLALRILQSLEAPVAAGNAVHSIGAGIGIALIPQEAQSADEALRKADVALYKAKGERRSSLRFFEAEMDAQLLARHQLDTCLRNAIARGDIKAQYLPTIDTRTGRVVAFEIVAFWQDPVLGQVPHYRFLPVAEEAGLIHQLMEQLLTQACAAAARWPAHVAIAIDVFISQLRAADFGDRVLQVLAATGFDPHRLELQISESALVQDLETAQRVLTPLRSRGIRIVLDNFGTGYSSLFHLRNFRVDKIKIDRSIVEGASSSAEGAAIAEALVGLGRGLGLMVAAEGIGDYATDETILAGMTGVNQAVTRSDPVTTEAVHHLLHETSAQNSSAETGARSASGNP